MHQNYTVSEQNPLTPQTQGSFSNENTFIFSKTQNKSLCEGGTIGSMGTIMNSFGLQSATSTWVKPNEKRDDSTKDHSKSTCGKKLKVNYLKHLKLESKIIKHYKRKEKMYSKQ